MASVQFFMHFFVICKFKEDPVINSLYQPDNILPFICLWEPERAYSHANSSIWSKIKVVQDFMPIFIISKFDVDPIKIKLLSPWHFPYYVSIDI